MCRVHQNLRARVDIASVVEVFATKSVMCKTVWSEKNVISEAFNNIVHYYIISYFTVYTYSWSKPHNPICHSNKIANNVCFFRNIDLWNPLPQSLVLFITHKNLKHRHERRLMAPNLSPSQEWRSGNNEHNETGTFLFCIRCFYALSSGCDSFTTLPSLGRRITNPNYGHLETSCHRLRYPLQQ